MKYMIGDVENVLKANNNGLSVSTHVIPVVRS